MPLWKPEAYHGGSKNRNFFEGVYYKLIGNDLKEAYAIIPGVSFGKDKKNSHAFIQVFNGLKEEYHYLVYDVEDFWYSSTSPDMKVGDSHFNLDKIQLDIDKDGVKINGELKLSNVHSWPSAFLSPGAMGWFELAPFMECYYGILSFDNYINGTINVNGENINFENGKGYIEKNWGVSFPQSWIWMQSNVFDENDISIVVSLATIPWLFSVFPGFIIGFWYKKELYTFATYNNAKIMDLRIEKDLSTGDNIVYITTKHKRMYLDIKARRVGGYDLKAPLIGEMTGRCNESLRSTIQVTLYEYDKSGNKNIIYNGTGTGAGVEINGDMDKMIKDLKIK